MLRRTLACCLPALLFAVPGHAQGLVRTIDGPTSYYGMARSLLPVPDLNGDGDPELLAGAFQFGDKSSRVVLISGRYLRTGILPSSLGTLQQMGVLYQSDWGASSVYLGDILGNGRKYMAVGGTGDLGAGGSSGYVRLIYWEAGALEDGGPPKNSGVDYNDFGTSLALVGDLDLDGAPDFAVGAPGPLQNSTGVGFVDVFSSAKWAIGQYQPLMHFQGTQALEQFGQSLGTADFDGDGKLELIVGAPGWGAGSGRVTIYKGGTGVLWRTLSGVAGERLGTSLSAGKDVTGDGVPDLLVGAPLSDAAGADAGRALLVSGAKLVANAAPFEHYVLSFGKVGEQLGSSVALTGDLNGDGRADMLVGAPEYDGTVLSQNIGAVLAYSGETGQLMTIQFGAAGERLGRTVAGLPDYSSDGLADIGLGVPDADPNGADSGKLQVWSLFPTKPFLYCTAKPNSLGCLSAIGSSGSPSASTPAPFQVKASALLSSTVGLMFYGYQPNAAPFLGGTLCVGGALQRVGAQASGGSTPPVQDCTGTFAYDFNARIQSGADLQLVVGQEVFCQYWSRDVAASFGSNTTNALRFVINP